jgi:hypothetical protein
VSTMGVFYIVSTMDVFYIVGTMDVFYIVSTMDVFPKLILIDNLINNFEILKCCYGT